MVKTILLKIFGVVVGSLIYQFFFGNPFNWETFTMGMVLGSGIALVTSALWQLNPIREALIFATIYFFTFLMGLLWLPAKVLESTKAEMELRVDKKRRTEGQSQ